MNSKKKITIVLIAFIIIFAMNVFAVKIGGGRPFSISPISWDEVYLDYSTKIVVSSILMTIVFAYFFLKKISK